MPIRTLLFDFGNVVAFFDHQRAVAQLARHSDRAPAELMLELYGGPIEDDYEVGKLSTAEYVREAKLNGRLTCTDEQFRTMFCDIFWPNPEVIDLLPALAKHYRLVLASNTNDAHFTKYTAQFAGELKPFAHLVASHHAGARKPHPEFFAYAHRFAGAEPHECLFVDDLPVNIEAAERFGWKGVVYRPGGSLAKQLREHGIRLAS